MKLLTSLLFVVVMISSKSLLSLILHHDTLVVQNISKDSSSPTYFLNDFFLLINRNYKDVIQKYESNK